MITYNNLYPKIISFENIHLAYRKARKGKRFKTACQKFELKLEENLLSLQSELATFSWEPGDYTSFYINEGKKRLISAAPFRDRIVHHALCNIIEPIFEKTFIYDSYANRQGKGTHKALKRARAFFYENQYVLKCDIKKYFPSIDHCVLKGLIKRKIACQKTLNLIDLILDKESDCQKFDTLSLLKAPMNNQQFLLFPEDETLYNRKYSLPLGNLTSQFFANIYLNPLDHFVKEKLKARFYLRYVDDFLIFSNSKSDLAFYRKEINHFLNEKLLLILHPSKQEIFPVFCGLDFVGYRILPDRIKVRKENVYRFKRRSKRRLEKVNQGKMSWSDFKTGIQSWIAHSSHADSYALRTSVFNDIFRVKIENRQPCETGRELEQYQCKQLAIN